MSTSLPCPHPQRNPLHLGLYQIARALQSRLKGTPVLVDLNRCTAGLGLDFRIRTRSGQGIGTKNGSTSRAASVHVGVLRASNVLAGSKVASPHSTKSQHTPVSLTRASRLASRMSLERMRSSRPVQQLSVKGASPPIQGTTSKFPSEMLPRQTEPAIVLSSTNAPWLAIASYTKTHA